MKSRAIAGWFARVSQRQIGQIVSVMAVVCVGLSACGDGTKTPSQIPIADITQSQLNDLLIPVDYGALVNRSLAGDRDALVQLIKLGDQTDGGGAYGFGALLKDIALDIGDEKFAVACKALSESERKLTFLMMEMGFEYGDRELSPEDLPRVLPLTVAALNPDGGT